jgi:hypothetical protein
MHRVLDWRFADDFDEVRRDRLSSIVDFRAVIHSIVGSIRGLSMEVESGRAESLRECSQPVFRLTVSEEAFDAFFNSPCGYRAQFLSDPCLGVASGLSLTEALRPLLLSWVAENRPEELDRLDVRASLAGISCKAWICEDDFPFDKPSKDLAINQWLMEAVRGERKAMWGLCAPRGTGIEVKGALLNRTGDEVIPRDKVFRRFDIHQFGFS